MYEIMAESFPVRTLLGNKSLSISSNKLLHLSLIKASKQLCKLVRQNPREIGVEYHCKPFISLQLFSDILFNGLISFQYLLSLVLLLSENVLPRFRIIRDQSQDFLRYYHDLNENGVWSFITFES